MIWMGCSFGVFIIFKVFCSVVGVGKVFDFFKMDVKEEMWWIVFVIGGLIGGYIVIYFL